MDSILEAGIEQILWLQSHGSPSLDAFFHEFTKFGGRHYLFMVPLLLWAIDHRTGSRVLAWMTFTLILNSVIKDAIAQPRPFQFDPRVQSNGEMGFGLPSGHAQLVVIFWGLLAAWVANRAFWLAALFIMGTMALSRVILGVHFPTDVYAGLLLGAGTLFVALRYGAPMETWLRSLPRDRLLQLVCTCSIGVIAMSWLMSLLIDGHSRIEGNFLIGCAGFVFGGGLGLIQSHRAESFAMPGPPWKRGIRYVVGTATLLILVRIGSQTIDAAGSGLFGAVLLYLTLVALGYWLTAGASVLFRLLRLAPR